MLIMILFTPPLAKIALKFGPSEMFWIAIFGISVMAGLSSGSIAKGLIGGMFGLLISTIGYSPLLGVPRFVFHDVLTGGIAIVYLLSFVMGLFGVQMGFLYGNSLLSIGISLFVVVIAALNLVLDFEFIEKGSQANLPKYMEWYGSFGLLVTLVWLYLEILRLLSKLASRN
jgi:uncharacterized YccA/Bax inhibitor family protein